MYFWGNSHLRKHPLEFPIHLEHLLESTTIGRNMPPPNVTAIIKAFCDRVGFIRLLHLYADSFQDCVAFFSVPFSCPNFCRMMNDCCSAYKYLVFSFCIESEQFNVGQQYHLCLRIEWQLSKRRKAFGVLGSPEKISMDNG